MSLSYAFSSEPRAATEGRYREEDDERVQNLMHDHRVVRGSTYAQQRKVAARAQEEEQKLGDPVLRKKPRKVRNIYAYKAPKPERREVDLSVHLEEQTPLPVSAAVGSQTVDEAGECSLLKLDAGWFWYAEEAVMLERERDEDEEEEETVLLDPLLNLPFS